MARMHKLLMVIERDPVLKESAERIIEALADQAADARKARLRVVK